MNCLLITTALLATIVTSGALDIPGTIKNKIEHILYGREKRQAPRRRQQQSECIQLCMRKMSNEYEKLDISPQSIALEATGLISKETAENFEAICRNYNDGKACLSDCPDFSERMLAQFTNLEVICGENYEAWKNSMDCFANTEGAILESCHPSCGGEDYIRQEMLKMPTGRGNTQDKQSQMDAMRVVMQGLENICTHTDCVISCAIPILDEQCQSTQPGQLLKQRVGVSLQQTVGRIPMPLKNCDAAATKYGDTANVQLPDEKPNSGNKDDDNGNKGNTAGGGGKQSLGPNNGQNANSGNEGDGDESPWDDGDGNNNGNSGTWGGGGGSSSGTGMPIDPREIQEMVDLQRELMNRNIAVLDKEEEKLEMEITKLQMEMTLLEKQLGSADQPQNDAAFVF